MNRFFKNDDARTVDGDFLWVSTRDLMNSITGRNFQEDYETSVFNAQGFAIHTDRYKTEAEARVGHATVIESIDNGSFVPNGKGWKDFR